MSPFREVFPGKGQGDDRPALCFVLDKFVHVQRCGRKKNESVKYYIGMICGCRAKLIFDIVLKLNNFIFNFLLNLAFIFAFAVYIIGYMPVHNPEPFR